MKNCQYNTNCRFLLLFFVWSKCIMSSPAISHNLDIFSYNLEELFQLLDLPLNPSKEDLFKAKQKVLKFHPDKSRLPNEYFIFYKKAYDIASNYYNEQNRQTRVATEDNTTYNASNVSEHKPVVQKSIEKIDKKKFNSKFNEIFEEKAVVKKENLNGWFSTDAPIYETPKDVNAKNMSSAFEKIKEKNQAMIVRKDVQDFYYNSGNSFYEDEDPNEYISSDPFSKLKYDDLRKVHKDQTIFAVGEKDFQKVAQFSSVDQYQQNRTKESQSYGRSDKEADNRILAKQEEARKQQHLQRLHASNLKSMQYENMNKDVLSSFMYLEN